MSDAATSTRVHRIRVLQAAGWERLSSRGSQTWRHPDVEGEFTLAMAYRVERWRAVRGGICPFFVAGMRKGAWQRR